MKAGETERFDCEECSREFEIVYEPKATTPKEKKGIEDADVTNCPFCGASLAAGEDDDDDEDL